jgi:hypothetical protein
MKKALAIIVGLMFTYSLAVADQASCEKWDQISFDLQHPRVCQALLTDLRKLASLAERRIEIKCEESLLEGSLESVNNWKDPYFGSFSIPSGIGLDSQFGAEIVADLVSQIANRLKIKVSVKVVDRLWEGYRVIVEPM